MNIEEFDALIADKRKKSLDVESGLTWTKKWFMYKPADECPHCGEYQLFAYEVKKSKRGKKSRSISQRCTHCDYLEDHAEDVPVPSH